MRYIHELTRDAGIDDSLLIRADKCPYRLNGRNRVNILALGDVGTTMLIGLRLLGGDVISEIGIMDIRPENTERLEMEINQIGYPFGKSLRLRCSDLLCKQRSSTGRTGKHASC